MLVASRLGCGRFDIDGGGGGGGAGKHRVGMSIPTEEHDILIIGELYTHS